MAEPGTVLALTPSIGGYYFGELLTGLNREIAAAGGRLLLVQTPPAGARDDGVECSTFSTPVAWSHIDGVVSVTTAARGTYLQQLRDAGKPVVLVSTRMPDFEAPLAVPDNRGGARAAVEHLISHGHTRIGFVGNLGQPDIRDRHAAYLQVLRAHGLRAEPGFLYRAANNDWTGGEEAARALLAGRDRPTAVFAATDRNAIGLMRTLAEAGLGMPRDLAVIGFDDVEAAAFSTPTLSSVRQRFDDVGALAGRMLLERIRGRSVAFREHVLPTSILTLRGSCGCATDAMGVGIEHLDPLPGATAAPRRWDELQATIVRSLYTGHRAIDGPARRAVRATVGEIERVVRAGDAATAEELLSVTDSINDLSAHPVVQRRIVGAVLDHLRSAPGGEPSAAAATQLIAALWRLQVRAFLQQVESTQTALEEQYQVDAGLLDGQADARDLAWLTGTHVRAGVLALWEGGPSSGRLRIAGHYDPHGLLADPPGDVTTPQQFPPPALLDAAGTPDGGVCIVVPVASAEDDWGLLAVIGEINTASTLETYRHWATQLCASFQEEKLQEAVRDSEQRYALAARATNDGLWEWDLGTDAFYMSERCIELVGLDRADAERRLDQWRARVHPDDVGEMEQAMGRVLSGSQQTVSVEYRVRAGDGTHRWVLSRALSVRSADGGAERLVGSLSDIHDRRSLEEQLRANALHDELTGLPNRRLFLARLEHAVELQKRFATPFAVIFLDLDGFKAINDSLGHQMGDRLLAAVGDRIQGELRGVDTGARFGGDEFAILLHDATHDDVLRVARRVQSAVREVIAIDGHEFVIGASLGVTTSDVDYSCAEDVLRDADTAMYHAKETERGTLAFFDETMHARALNQLRLNAELRRALDDGQFEVHFQPIVDLVSGRADEFEALVRWRHPERGLVPPGEFLPLMAETGLIVPLGQWVIDEVCRRLAEWGPAVAGVSVNLSDREFWHADLLAHLSACLTRHDVDPGRLTLEITEGVIMRRPEAARRLMQAMHAAGLRLHIDDFGTGYSSLETLHKFPVDALKIDRSFVAGLATGDHSDELVRAIIAMGAALDLTVVAEGVETDLQLRFLRQAGCEAAQGFRFRPAVAGDEVAAILGTVFCTEQRRAGARRPATAHRGRPERADTVPV